MSDGDLLAHLARFGGALRARGIGVTLRDEADGAEALTVVDLADRDEVRRALRISLKIRPQDRQTFEALFDELWVGRGVAPRRRPPSTRPPGEPGVMRPAAAGALAEREIETADADGGNPGYSPQPLLRRKPFEECSDRDLAAMERLLARMALRLATTPSRRLVPMRNGGIVDLRRSLRGALATRGELFSFARRDRAIEEARLVLLCDTSGSMDAYTRFLLTFILSLRRVARRTEVFVFNTELTRLTRWLAPHRIQATLERVAREVPDWSGGTRIGECLESFVGRFQDGLVTAKTVVVILSDGLDRGEPARLVRAMRAIRRRARKILWINPLMGDPRYRPTARGMAAALPFVNHLVPGHNLEALQRILPLMVA